MRSEKEKAYNKASEAVREAHHKLDVALLDYTLACRKECDAYVEMVTEEIEAEARAKAVPKPEASRRYATVKWQCDVCHVSGEIENVPLDISGIVMADKAEVSHARLSPDCDSVRGGTKLEFTIDYQAGV